MEFLGNETSFEPQEAADLSGVVNDLRHSYGLLGLGLFVRHGQRSSLATFGRASISFEVPVKRQTLFHVGSLGKQITATLLVRHMLRAGVDLEAEIGNLVNDLPSDWGGTTLRQLLSHTSGIPDYIPHVPIDRGIPNAEVYRRFSHLPRRFAPGTAFEYSNTNYRLIGDALEEHTGLSYATLVEELFEEAGLPDGGIDDPAVIKPHQATPYSRENGTYIRALDHYRTNVGSADGGIRMSSRDAAAWDAAFWGGRLLSSSEIALTMKPNRLHSGAPVPYGFGWHIDRGADGNPLVWHGGTMPGFRAIYMASPHHDLAVFVLSNCFSGMLAEDHIAHAIAERLAPGSTVLGARLERDPQPELTRSAASLMFTDRDSLDMSIFVPWMRPLTDGLRTLAGLSAPDEFTCVMETPEDWGAEKPGLLRRYRMRWGRQLRHVAIAYAGDGRIYRIWQC